MLRVKTMKNALILTHVDALAKICPRVAKVYLENKFYKLTAKDIVAMANTSNNKGFKLLKGDPVSVIEQLMKDGNRLLKKPEEGLIYWAKGLSSRAKTTLAQLGYTSKEQLMTDLNKKGFYLQSCKDVGDKIDFEVQRWFKRNNTT